MGTNEAWSLLRYDVDGDTVGTLRLGLGLAVTDCNEDETVCCTKTKKDSKICDCFKL